MFTQLSYISYLVCMYYVVWSHPCTNEKCASSNVLVALLLICASDFGCTKLKTTKNEINTVGFKKLLD